MYIVRGIEYLENCCKFKLYTPPQPPFLLFKSGGIIVPSYEFLLGEEKILEKLLALIEKQKVFSKQNNNFSLYFFFQF